MSVAFSLECAGRIRLAQARPDDAEAAFRALAALAPDAPAAWLGLAEVALYRGAPADALRHARTAATRRRCGLRGKAQVALLTGQAEALRGRWQAATAAWSAARIWAADLPEAAALDHALALAARRTLPADQHGPAECLPPAPRPSTPEAPAHARRPRLSNLPPPRPSPSTSSTAYCARSSEPTPVFHSPTR